MKESNDYRVRITIPNKDKLNAWIQQVQTSNEATVLNVVDLVNWIINALPASPTPAQVAELCSLYFDPIKALQVATKKALDARSKGQKVELSDVLTLNKPKRLTKNSSSN
jgi:hypothetical protein